MRTSAIVRIVIFSVVIAILLGIMVVGMLGNAFLFNTTTGGTISSEGSVNASEIHSVEVEWVGGSITVQTADTDTITFSETGAKKEEDTMVWKQTGGGLKIQFQEAKYNFGISFGFEASLNKDLLITVPKDWTAKEFSIESVSADIEIAGITAKNFELDNVSGTCELKDCGIGELDVNTVSGKVDLNGSVQNVSLEAVSANCQLFLSAGTKQIDMESVSGDLTVYLPADQGFTASIEGIGGDLSTDFPTTVSGSKYIHGDGSCKIEAEGVSGNVSIRKRPTP